MQIPKNNLYSGSKKWTFNQLSRENLEEITVRIDK